MRFIAVLLLAALFSACTERAPNVEERVPTDSPDMESVPFRDDGELTFYRPGEGDIVTIRVEIAESQEEITRGLMGRERLPDRSGMLFLMPQTRIQSFWMANTPLPLDITFIGPDSTVINTAKYTRPFSPESHSSEAPARFVVETQAGFTDTHGIVAGDRVRWVRR